jgi:hypothetical protein
VNLRGRLRRGSKILGERAGKEGIPRTESSECPQGIVNLTLEKLICVRCPKVKRDWDLYRNKGGFGGVYSLI